MGAALASAAAHAIALTSAASGAAGAIALVPAALAATVVTAVAANVATFGLGEAWKATGQAATGGGGAAANVAKRVAMAHREVRDATRALADAQRDALDAQQAVTRARMDETERLQDLTRSLAGAKLDEEGAVLAVAEAEKELDRARRKGKPDDIRAADLAYRQALQTLEDVRDRVGDLTQEQEEGQKKGVEGSDAVQQSLRRQEEAQRAVAQAAERLADAQDAVKEASQSAAAGGIDPAAEALARLAPNARAVILTLRALVPAWQSAARAGQNATFANVAGDLRRLSGVYLPMATTWLARMGGSFNTAIRQSMGLATTKGFVRDTGLFLNNTALATDRLARAFRPMINGLMQFVAVGSGFLPGISGSVGTLAERFERWAIASRESGKMQQWISNALGVLRQLGSVAGDVVMSVVAIFKAGDNQGATLDGLVKGAAAMRAWLESAEGQERVTAVMTTLRSILTGIGQIVPVVAGQAESFNAGWSVTGEIVRFAAGHLDTLAKLLPVIAAGYIISRTAQTAANIALVIALPLRVAEMLTMRSHTAALRANTATLAGNTTAKGVATGAAVANTAATVAGDVATKRSIVSMIAAKAALVATSIATKAAAIGQWLLNAAMYANPVGLIVLAVIALVAGIVLLWKNSETFRNIVTGVWQAVWGAMKAVWAWVTENFPKLFHILTTPHRLAWAYIKWAWAQVSGAVTGTYNWVVGKMNALISFFTKLPGRISKAASSMWNGLGNSFRSVINRIIGLWNNLSFTIGGGTHFGITIPSLTLNTPNIPYLAAGGNITRGGSVVVGDGGEPEIVNLPAGATVTPLSRAGAGGPMVMEVRDGGSGSDRVLARWFHESVRTGKIRLFVGGQPVTVARA